MGEMLAACGPARVAVVVHQAAVGEGLVDLGVQVVAVGENQKGEVATQFAMDLAGEEHHRIALARTLGMPEHPRLAAPMAAVADRLDGPVDAEKLVVAGQNLSRVPGRVVENDEVFHQVQEIVFRAHPLEQRLHGHDARLILGQPFPLVKMLEPAGDRAEFGIHPVGQHNKSVVMEQMRDGVLVIEKVLLIGGAGIAADVLQLHEQQRQAVDEPDDIRPAAVQIAPHPQLPHAEEMVVLGNIEVEDPQSLAHPLAFGVAKGDPHPVLDQFVLLTVGGGHGLRGGNRDDLTDGIVIGRGR